jgi:DNA-binding MarR family transcriptional regulator
MKGRILELISTLHLDWTRRIARDLAPHAITPKQIFLLRKLDEAGTLGPSEIAVLLHGDRPSATSMLGTLERAGWVRRRRHPEDGKRVQVELTGAGREKLASVPLESWRSGHTRFDPLACLDPGEREQLARLLEKLRRALEDEP